MRRAIDPLLPRPGVEQRVIQQARERVNTEPSPSRRWVWPLRTTLGGGLMALAVVALIGGALGITLSLRGHLHESTASSSLPVSPTKPPINSTTSPTTAATPSTVSYVAPTSISFPTTSDGWAVGNACDSQRRCEVGVARSTDGGATWALVSSPVSPEATSYGLRVVGSSSIDAWVWGSDFDRAGRVCEYPQWRPELGTAGHERWCRSRRRDRGRKHVGRDRLRSRVQ